MKGAEYNGMVLDEGQDLDALTADGVYTVSSTSSAGDFSRFPVTTNLDNRVRYFPRTPKPSAPPVAGVRWGCNPPTGIVMRDSGGRIWQKHGGNWVSVKEPRLWAGTRMQS